MGFPECIAKVVMVEDDPDDIWLTKALLSRKQIHLDITFYRDGEELVEAFNEQATDVMDAPDLFVLDLNLPKMSGREVLSFTKATERLAHVPVVICSGSAADKDVQDTKRLGAEMYLEKPFDDDSIDQLVGSMEQFEFIEHEDVRYLVNKSVA